MDALMSSHPNYESQNFEILFFINIQGLHFQPIIGFHFQLIKQARCALWSLFFCLLALQIERLLLTGIRAFYLIR